MVDIAVLISVAAATSGLAVLLHRWGTRGSRLWKALWIGFFGLFLTISMVAHCLDVLSRLVIGTSYAGEPLVYDFRVYSLFLLGAVLAGLGIQIVAVVHRLAHGDATARHDGVRATVIVLAVTVPLLPVHAFFATILTTLAVLSLLVLAAVGRTPVRPEAESVRAVAKARAT